MPLARNAPGRTLEALTAVDRAQHTRYLAYLKRYEYFGRGKVRLAPDEFAALESEAGALESQPGADAARRRRSILAALMKEG
jgi:hypothetical protein